ncbi:MAG TPA: hypothetical protein VHX37_08850 [Acidobacteriaceae bacterium]|jgi:hypothetical protein|nr:hypothetical protein [Acidobacteriaceae bacterium]
MYSDSLIRQLFAIERAIGYVSKDELRAMVIAAQETALENELGNLRGIETLRRRLEDSQRMTFLRLLRSEDSGNGRRSA